MGEPPAGQIPELYLPLAPMSEPDRDRTLSSVAIVPDVAALPHNLMFLLRELAVSQVAAVADEPVICFYFRWELVSFTKSSIHKSRFSLHSGLCNSIQNSINRECSTFHFRREAHFFKSITLGWLAQAQYNLQLILPYIPATSVIW